MKRPPALPDAIAAIPPEGIALESLAEAANALLAQDGVVARDGRVASSVDARTIRFYQTLGILPKPRYTGRRASYGPEHLVRVLAAKQLQAEGYSLAQVQSSLPQRSTDDLLRALIAKARSATEAPPPLRSDAPSTTHLLSVRLAEGVTVLIDPARVVDPITLAQVLAAAIESAAASDPSIQRGSR